MGEVIQLGQARDAKWRERAAASAQHPALRWVAGATYWLAHRRDHDTGTAHCGAPGALVLAPPGVPQCTDCYPPIPTPRQGRA